MASPVHHLVKPKHTFPVSSEQEKRSKCLDYGESRHYEAVSFDCYAIGPGYQLWQVVRYCRMEMIDALLAAIERQEASA